MLMKRCPRCKRWMQYGPTYCEDCAPIAKAELETRRQEAQVRKAKAYNKQRDPKYLTFYRSKEWKLTSKTKLQSVGYKCEAKLPGCQGLAVEVHHTKPIQTAEGWTLRLEWSNLEAVCTSCHNGRHPEKLRGKQDPSVLDIKQIKKEIKS